MSRPTLQLHIGGRWLALCGDGDGEVITPATEVPLTRLPLDFGHVHRLAIAMANDLALGAVDELALRVLHDAMLMEWIEALSEQVNAADQPSVERRNRLVNQACEWMLSWSDEPPSILDLWSRVGISRRERNCCFVDVPVMTLVKYLCAVRPIRGRSALRSARSGVRVQEVAFRWGFSHLCQFGRDYRLLCGKKPSATLQRAFGAEHGERSC